MRGAERVTRVTHGQPLRRGWKVNIAARGAPDIDILDAPSAANGHCRPISCGHSDKIILSPLAHNLYLCAISHIDKL